MEIVRARELALAVADKLTALTVSEGRPKWQLQEYMQGFVGDVGALSKLVMVKLGQRSGRGDIDNALRHEVCDCFWSILIIADRLGIDLDRDFEIEMQKLASKLPSFRSDDEVLRLQQADHG